MIIQTLVRDREVLTTVTSIATNTLTIYRPTEPGFDSPVYGGIALLDGEQHTWLVAVSIHTGLPQLTITVLGTPYTVTRQDVVLGRTGATLPRFDRASLHAHGELVPLVEDGATVHYPRGIIDAAFQGIPSVTVIGQLCESDWFADWIRANLAAFFCPLPPPPVPVLDAASRDYAGFGIRDGRNASWVVIVSLSTNLPGGIRHIALLGINQQLNKEGLFVRTTPYSGDLPALDRASFHASGDIAPLVADGATVTLSAGVREVALQGIPTITALAQLCAIPWLVSHLSNTYQHFCPQQSGMSYTPDIGRVVHAAMADNFHRGIAFGESGFSFSGRYDDEDRAAGFAYDFGNFKLRTDYIRLPSKQDGEVWLDTYRLGVLRPLNDETQIFAGVDSYDNAIMAIDINTEGERWHRLGAAMEKGGKGYAIRYELRLNL